MGEVKVEVNLENPIDRELVRLGLLTEDQARSFAVMLVLPPDEVEALG